MGSPVCTIKPLMFLSNNTTIYCKIKLVSNLFSIIRGICWCVFGTELWSLKIADTVTPIKELDLHAAKVVLKHAGMKQSDFRGGLTL